MSWNCHDSQKLVLDLIGRLLSSGRLYAAGKPPQRGVKRPRDAEEEVTAQRS